MTYEQQASLVGKCGEGAMGMVDTSITLLSEFLSLSLFFFPAAAVQSDTIHPPPLTTTRFEIDMWLLFP